jgi:hypothetical protein
MICQNLDGHDVNALSQTNRRLYSFLGQERMKAHIESTQGSVLIWAVTRGYRLYCRSPRRRGQSTPEERVIELLTTALKEGANIDLKVSSGKWDAANPNGFSPAVHVAAAQPNLIAATRLLLSRGANVYTTAVKIWEFLGPTLGDAHDRGLSAMGEVLQHDFTDEVMCRKVLEEAPMLPLALPFASKDRKTSELLVSLGVTLDLVRFYGDSVVPTHLNALHMVS